MHFHNKYVASLLLIIILLIGAAFRFYDLGHVPPGLWYDEAFYADAAITFLQSGPRLIYYMRDEAQIGLFPTILAAGFWSMGDSLVALRATVAVWGMLGLIGCYYLCLELFYRSPEKKMVALAATFLLATSYWHLNYSRLAFSTSLVPTLEIAAMWLTLRALRTKRDGDAVTAGAATAFGLYSYWPYYAFLLLPAWLVVWNWLQNRRDAGRAFILYGITGTVVSMPLLAAFFTHDMLGRFRTEPSIAVAESHYFLQFYHQLSQFLHNSWLHVRMLLCEGDGNWRHNLSGLPALSPFAALGFIAALIQLFIESLRLFLSRMLQIWKKTAYSVVTVQEINRMLMLVAWIMIAIIPAALSNSALPHASRSIGMMVPCQLLAAFGYVLMVRYTRAWFNVSFIKWSLVIMALVMCLLQTALLATQYFVVFANSPDAKGSFILLDNGYLRHQFARDAQQIEN